MKKDKRVLLYTLLTFLVLFLFETCTVPVNQELRLIPKPAEAVIKRGHFTAESSILLKTNLSSSETAVLAARFSDLSGLRVSEFDSEKIDRKQKIVEFNVSEEISQEGYHLLITGQKIIVEAQGMPGFLNGLSTVFQLSQLPKDESIGKSDGRNQESIGFSLPAVEISDYPKFAWRGLMLDCSRTFIPASDLKLYIDALSLYKMNVLHLHLTDDQGWRLEIDQYPELTQICSQSHPKYSNEKGGFYSKKDMKELINYASERNITIVPEIEMPGHSSEVFAAFPELSCTGNRTEIFPFFSGPGITNDIFCAGEEEVFVFIENVLDEVCQLFPSDFIHIGGDEAPKVRWDNCEKCKKRIQDEGLNDSHELQSYFIRRVEEMLSKRGKKLIGWDEILEGGLAENAAVMSWRGVQGGIAAARAGHSVVMSPTSHCYFDYSHGTTSVKRVYEFNPIPDELSIDESTFILGAQANFWSHIDRQSYAMQRQIFPRILALSERLWNETQYDYSDFEKRLAFHYPVLDTLGINYYHPSKIIQQLDSSDFTSRLNLEGYEFDFHGFRGAEFNYQGMSCKVVLPQDVAEGNPWVWRARFWGHEPQFDIALLEKGYHIVYCEVGDLYGNEVAVDRWNRFYQLMQKGGLAEKGILEGMSRGGLIIYNWAVENPDKVSGIYADAPVLDGFSWPGGFGQGKGSNTDWQRFKMAYQINTRSDSLNFLRNPIHKTKEIAHLGIPLIHVCGDADEVVPIFENTDVFEQGILKYGGKIKVIRKTGIGHHPHSLKDPSEIISYLLD